jgi:hypothetical protein
MSNLEKITLFNPKDKLNERKERPTFTEVLRMIEDKQKGQEDVVIQSNWICRFCNLTKPERHAYFFNDMLCVNCARNRNISLAF